MPLKTGPPSLPNGRRHGRTNSASSAWGRQSLGGALSFGSNRLPTHSENDAREGYDSRTASSSSGEEVMVVMDPNGEWQPESRRSEWPATLRARKVKSSTSPTGDMRGSISVSRREPMRRESVSADKAMKEVEKALASVEAH